MYLQLQPVKLTPQTALRRMISPASDTLVAAVALAAELGRRPGLVDKLTGEWIADHLARGAGAGTLSEALGLEQRADLVREHRNAILRDLAANFPDLSATSIADGLAQYHADIWPRMRLAPSCPHAPDSLEAWLWQMLQLWPAPLRPKQVRRVLQGTSSYLDVPRPGLSVCSTQTTESTGPPR